MLITILHLIALPIVIIAALVNGLVPIAVVDGMIFLMLFALEYMLWPARFHLPRLHAVRVPGFQAH